MSAMMKVYAAIALALIVPSAARGEERASRAGDWVGGASLLGGVQSNGVNVGGHGVVRYRFLQAGGMATAATDGGKLAVATLGWAIATDRFDFIFEGLYGAHTLDPSSSSLFGPACKWDGNAKTLRFAGAMFTFARTMKNGGGVGVSVFAGRDLERQNVNMHYDCTSWSVGWGSGSSEPRRSSYERDKLVGGEVVGVMFRLTLGMF